MAQCIQEVDQTIEDKSGDPNGLDIVSFLMTAEATHTHTGCVYTLVQLNRPCRQEHYMYIHCTSTDCWDVKASVGEPENHRRYID